jgi:hypothetical protein
MIETTKILEQIKNYDAEQFSIQLLHWVRELNYFYSKLVEEQGGNPSTTYYNIKPKSKRPKEGQVAYFNLRRGYPKELFDGHWCYILKDFKMKFLVIPLTSVKDNSEPNQEFEFDIQIDNFKNQLPSRMNVTDIRAIDAHRINEREGVYNVKTDREYILNEVNRILSLQEDGSMVKSN